MDKKVPAVPSLDGIQDPAVKNVLQILFDGWSVRNGSARDQGAQFVTRDDMEHFLGKGSWQSNALSGGASSGNGNMATMVPGGISTAFRAVIAGIIDNIKNSALWKDLTSRISDSEATAKSAGLLGAESMKVATTVDGTISGAWSVKFDANGYVVGAGLGIEGKDGHYDSEFLVRADRFAVGSPSQTDLFPFIVDTHDGHSVIALNGQLYIGATSVSDSGVWTSYVFKESATAPAAPTGTDITPTGWSDAPPATHTNPVWMSKSTINAYTGLAGTWSAPIKVTGADGAAGKFTAYQYAKSASTDVAPIAGWQATPYAVATGEYLWMRAGIVVPPATEPEAWETPYRVTGEKGSNGSNGSAGSAGVRGSVTAYGSASSWSDSGANSLIYSQTSTSYLVIGDTVTLSNGSSFTMTKYWTGGSWASPGVVIDGNLLVTGTVSGSKINGGSIGGTSLKIADLYGNWILQANYNGVDGCSLWKPYLAMAQASNTGNPSVPALKGISVANEGLWGYGSSSSTSTCHGVRGSQAGGMSGLVGVQNGYDFYADGSGINYGPFTGAHDALLSVGESVEVGDIVVDVDCLVRRGVSNTLCHVRKSDQAYQKATVGVIARINGHLDNTYMPAVFDQNNMMIDDYGNAFNQYTAVYNDLKNDYNYVVMNALGEGQVQVCGENGDLEPGDLIVTSPTPGKGMKQADDVIRSYTVAKAREAVTFASPDEVKLVACIYLCG